MAAMRTRFTDLVGCRLPLQLAALGGVATRTAPSPRPVNR
jgi:hypothetical protein